MGVVKKIYATIFIWALISVVVFYYGFPKVASGLFAIEANHQEQQAQYNNLREQIQSLYAMQQDLDQIQKQPVKPADLFTSDVQLVKEIQHIEEISKTTGNDMRLTISGSADQAKLVKTSGSQLYEVPYTITLSGTFPQTLQFLHYFENSYFVSPVNAINVDNTQIDAAGQVKTTLLASFFIHKDSSSTNDKAKSKN